VRHTAKARSERGMCRVGRVVGEAAVASRVRCAASGPDGMDGCNTLVLRMACSAKHVTINVLKEK
jgi:hypothetical protein